MVARTGQFLQPCGTVGHSPTSKTWIPTCTPLCRGPARSAPRPYYRILASPGLNLAFMAFARADDHTVRHILDVAPPPSLNPLCSYLLCRCFLDSFFYFLLSFRHSFLWSGTMASSTPLQLFPSITHTTQPRKSSLKKTRPTEVAVAPGELKGNALLVHSAPGSPSFVVQPANNQIKHSLFCDPSSSEKVTTSNRSGPRRHLRARRRSSASSVTSATIIPGRVTPPSEEDQLSDLPINSHFGTRRPSKGHLQRPALPQNISTEAQPDTDQLMSPGGDTVSPLPSKLQFSPRRAEFPASNQKRSQSPAGLSRSASMSTAAPPYSPPATRSIFPQYDPTKSLQEQEYYPTVRSPTPTLPNEKVNKGGFQMEKKRSIDPVDSAVALVEGYEHIPSATSEDMMAVWNASCNNFPVPGRKVQIGLLQPQGKGTSLAIGTSENELIYSMCKEEMPAKLGELAPLKQLIIKKHNPQTYRGPPSPVAQMALPDPNRPAKERENDVVTIFPQMAAVKAIEDVSNSPMAAEIATFDPTAKSPEAARLAKDAVSDAHTRHRCDLVRNTRKRDSLGAVTASYRLEHPTLGPFAITVTKSTIGRHSRDPRAKISIHHPSATPAAVSAETLVLAFLDFARDACVLDVPGLLALESGYIIDTVVCALFAVAVIENDVLMAETLTFAAPPKSPLPLSKNKSGSRGRSSSDESKRSSMWGRKDKKAKKAEEQLPVLTQGALAVLGLSFKTAVFILEAGVKITAGAVIGISHLAQKL